MSGPLEQELQAPELPDMGDGTELSDSSARGSTCSTTERFLQYRFAFGKVTACMDPN